ncbi:MAG: helix-turn-helix transcriptional regulator [Planctomycetota bacterium]|nr:helix-turn-helix transcriptional regulator [Planctomycetota bacterium]MDP7254636.1 helix-turn-helix transcriptional regulator [Planctomycetota bacterium]
MSVGQRVRDVRKARKLTQTDLGNALGVSQRTISDLESGKGRVRTDLVLRVAKKLEIQIEELYGWDSRQYQSGSAAESSRFVLPIRAHVPLSNFTWPEKVVEPPELIDVPSHLYQG